MTPQDFSLVDSIAVAMLTTPSCRNCLIKKTDHLSALKALKSCPPLAEHQVGEVVYRARKIHDAFDASLAKINDQIKIQRIHHYEMGTLQASDSFEALLRDLNYE